MSEFVVYLRWNASNRVEEAAHASFDDLSPLLANDIAISFGTGVKGTFVVENADGIVVEDLGDFVVRDPELLLNGKETQERERESIVSGSPSNQSIDR